MTKKKVVQRGKECSSAQMRRWMIENDFFHRRHRKSVYLDGRERKDVLQVLFFFFLLLFCVSIFFFFFLFETAQERVYCHNYRNKKIYLFWDEWIVGLSTITSNTATISRCCTRFSSNSLFTFNQSIITNHNKYKS